MKVCRLPEFIHKNILMNNYFSRDQHLVILAWVQSWNIFEKLMKLWCTPEFIHKFMSHGQLPFMWSTLRDSSIGAKMKYFWKTHETVKSARSFFTKTWLTNNYFSRDPHSVITHWKKTHALLTENLCSLQTSGVIIVLSHGGKLCWMKPTGRRVARNFDKDGANNNQASTFEYSKSVFFKDSSVKHAFFWFFKFRFMPAKKKYLFMELTSFKSLFLVTFLASTLHRRLHLFVKFSC